MVGIMEESTIPAQSKKDLISHRLLRGQQRELRLICVAQPEHQQLTYGKAKPTIWADQPVNVFGQRYL